VPPLSRAAISRRCGSVTCSACPQATRPSRRDGGSALDDSFSRPSCPVQTRDAISSTTPRGRTCSRPSCRRRRARPFSNTSGRVCLRPWHRAPDLGNQPGRHFHRRLRLEYPHRGHRLLRPTLPAEGRWQDRQLVPETWIDAATARQTSNGSSPDSDWDQGYGYQFLALPLQRLPGRWRLRPVLHRVARAGCSDRHYQRREGYAGRPEPDLGQTLPALRPSPLAPNEAAQRDSNTL